MQNKANFLDIQMNVSYVKTKNYEQKTMANEPIKQSQTKPTCGEHSRTIYGELACTELSRSVEPTKPISIPKTLKTYPRNDPPSLRLRRGKQVTDHSRGRLCHITNQCEFAIFIQKPPLGGIAISKGLLVSKVIFSTAISLTCVSSL